MSDSTTKSDGLLPAVVKVPSINDRDTEQTSKSKINTQKIAAKNDQNKRNNEHILKAIIKQKMRDSWLDSTHQRRIWNARKRLTRGEWLETLPELEKQVF